MKLHLWLALFVGLNVYGQQSPRYGTLLWKISGNGLKKPSYLYGTMHVSNRVAYYLSEEFFDALKNVDVVGLETNPGEWLENMEKTGELSQLTRVSEPFSRNFYKSAFHTSFPEKRIFVGILSYDPDIINGLLYRANKSRENFEESTYIDLFIYQTATKLDKPVISLEDFARSEIKARLSAVPDDDQQNNRQYTDYVNAQKIEDAYRRGDLDVIDSLSKLSTSRNMQKFLINDRNVEFAETIDSVMKQHTIFSGVGAAHLPGEQGLIELLRRKGYNVEPVEPSISKKSHKERERIDEMVRPVEFSTQYAADSLFSVELPGKLYKILDAGQLKYYVHADMANGSFYSVARLKHMGPLFNITPAQVFAKVDSLLFEHIPGRIIEKNQIVSGGYQGMEIINRTRRGDVQHYQIFFSDQEMILFKLGGKQDYATSEQAKRFFESIRFAPVTVRNFRFTPPTGGFSVTISGEFHYERNKSAGIAGLCEDLFVSSGRAAMGVRHAVYNDFSYLEEDTFELNQLAAEVLQAFNYTADQTFTLSAVHGFPAITFSGKNTYGNWLTARILICGVHYYLVYQADSVRHDAGKGFIGSFVPGEFVYVHPIKRITDDELHFTAYDEVTDDAYSRFSEMYAKAYDQALGKKDTLAPAGYRALSKYYYSPSSNEYVGISFEQYSDYDFRDPETTASSLEKNFRSNTSMFVVRSTSKQNGGIHEYNYVLGDTATQRVLGVRVIFCGNRMYELTASYDSITGMQGWQKKFFESFAPVDSSAENSIFNNSFPKFLSDLSGADTALRRKANSALLDGLAMHDVFADDYVSFIGSDKIRGVNEDSKAYLFVNGGTLRDNRIIAPYKKLYMQYTDSFFLQLCLLKGLAYVKTPEAFSAFAELIKKEPPLVGDESSVADVFSVLKDSLQICRSFFPEILSLTRYEEFRNPVYDLLSGLVEQKLINTSRYAREREAIVADAMLTLKRYNPAAKAESDEAGLSHLDRQARELAETIRRSLDGLANNLQLNMNTGTAARTKHPLVAYATILAPFYGKDEQVRQFFQRLRRIRSHDILLPTTVALLRYNVSPDDSLVSRYAADPHTRAWFYSELERFNIEHKFDSRYLSQQKLVESLLISQRQLNSYYGYDKSRGQDSIVMVEALPAVNKYQKGTIYVYKTASGRSDAQWSAVFVNHGGGDVTSRMELLSAGYTPDPAKSEADNLAELKHHFQLAYRKRALVNAGL